MSRLPISRRDAIVGAAAAAVVPFSPALATKLPTTHDIAIESFRFEPQNIQVRVGDSIRWTNHDLAPHTATATEFGWDTGELQQNQSATVTVTEAMEASYFCAFHPHMKGTIEII